MTSNAFQNVGVALFIGLVILTAIFLIGLCIVSLQAGVLYFVGMIVGIVVLLPIIKLFKINKLYALLAAGGVFGFLLLFLAFAAFFIMKSPGSRDSKLKIIRYQAFVQPVKDDLSEFKLSEKYLLEFEAANAQNEKPIKTTEFLTLPDKTIKSKSRSFFIDEVSFAPLNLSKEGSVTIVTSRDILTSQNQRSISLCSFDCPESYVRLIDFPKDSFSEARGAKNFERNAYLDKETITWEVERPDEGISFSYIPTRYQNFIFILKPFIAVSSLGAFPLILLGFLHAVLFIISTNLFGDKIKDSIQVFQYNLSGKTIAMRKK